MLYDLHIHSCLSPCADDNMTPCMIAGMAKLAGADVISIADHNSARNLPAAQLCCNAYGIKLLPCIEVNTAEEIHMLCYFPTVKAALAMSDMLYDGLASFEYDGNIWGKQLIVNEDDEIEGTLDKLLTSASALNIYETKAYAEGLGGIAVPAHAEKDSYSLLSVLGFCPSDLDFECIEMRNPCKYEALAQKQFLPANKPIITSSDAHCIDNIACCMQELDAQNPLMRLLK
ncbi:MAG: PHP domain-containing protein [Oscillospiraceae bacterium]